MNVPKSICVVGGGSSGLIAAMILKQRFNISVDVIRSKSIGTIGVGEGSTEHWMEFMDFVGINQYELIVETNATYKAGLMFENWNEDRTFFHGVGVPFSNVAGQYKYVLAKQIGNNNRYMHHNLFWKNRIPTWFLGKDDVLPVNQFHFDTNKLNDYLTKKAEELGVHFFDDTIININLDKQGNINTLTGRSNRTYDYDFYIDCTGFNRLLISKLGGKWKSYSKYLKMNSAIVFPTGDENNYNIWSYSKALNAGWRFKLPTWGRHGNGYIFDSNYITADEAKQEVERDLGFEVEVGKHLKYDTGSIDKPWIKNCVAVGLSCNFLEPLEASSIGITIQQMFILMHKLMNYNDRMIKDYNDSINSLTDNARDFVALHYMTKKTNTQFWIDAANNEIPDSLAEKLEIWKYKIPVKEDFRTVSDYILFQDSNFTMILDGLDIFDRNAIKQELLMHEPGISKSAQKIIDAESKWEKTLENISHKEFITKIRKNYSKNVDF